MGADKRPKSDGQDSTKGAADHRPSPVRMAQHAPLWSATAECQLAVRSWRRAGEPLDPLGAIQARQVKADDRMRRPITRRTRHPSTAHAQEHRGTWTPKISARGSRLAANPMSCERNERRLSLHCARRGQRTALPDATLSTPWVQWAPDGCAKRAGSWPCKAIKQRHARCSSWTRGMDGLALELGAFP